MALRLAIIGEAYGAEEEIANKAFVGQSGRLLNSLLSALGINRNECLITNVFNFRPPGNKIKKILVKKDEGAPGIPSLYQKYLPPDLLHCLDELKEAIRAFKPDGIIALGAVALWGLTGSYKLAAHRGHYHEYEGIPMIPTYHPARVLRSYFLKVSLAADLEKAKALASGARHIDNLSFISEPNISQIESFFAKAKANGICSCDIETSPKVRAITCIGFGLSDDAICIPFYHKDRPNFNYWPSPEEEISALKLIKDFLADDSVKKIFHHASYDIPWIFDIWGIRIRGGIKDTKIIHTCLFAELPHSLSDIAANYLMMPAWKAEWQSSKESDAGADSGEGE